METIMNKQYNRKQRRWAMYGKVIMPVHKIVEKRNVKRPDGSYVLEDVVVAYLHPRKGWKGNEGAILRAGYKINKRRVIG